MTCSRRINHLFYMTRRKWCMAATHSQQICQYFCTSRRSPVTVSEHWRGSICRVTGYRPSLNTLWAASTMDYSFLAARLLFTFVYTCLFFSWQKTLLLLLQAEVQNISFGLAAVFIYRLLNSGTSAFVKWNTVPAVSHFTNAIRSVKVGQWSGSPFS